MAVARQARWPLSAATYEALIGLLVVSGMRVGEAIRLDRADVSLTDGLLTGAPGMGDCLGVKVPWRKRWC